MSKRSSSVGPRRLSCSVEDTGTLATVTSENKFNSDAQRGELKKHVHVQLVQSFQPIHLTCAILLKTSLHEICDAELWASLYSQVV